MRIEFFEDENGSSFCDAKPPLSKITTKSQMIDFLNHMTSPILLFGETRCVSLSKSATIILADKFGSLLKGLWVELRSSITKKDLLYLLSRCPLLELLQLHPRPARSLLEDDDLFQMSGICMKLNTLCLDSGSAKNITDSGLVNALKRWPLICDLQLVGCKLLTDAVVPQILQCLPKLEILSVSMCSISKECILSLALVPGHLTSLYPSTDADSVWILAQLKERNLDWTIISD